jgi:VanZ family protein
VTPGSGFVKSVLWQWGPALVQMAVIFGYSSLSQPTIPFGVSDHIGHFAGYGLLGALVLRAFARAHWAGVGTGSAWRAVLFSSAYGASDEFHQHFVPGRTSAVDDWVADTLGAAVAVAGLLVVARLVTPQGRERREV